MTQALSRFLDVDTARYKLISTNLANIDTPGYHTRDLDFRAELIRAATEDSGLDEGQLVPASFNPVAHQVRGLMERGFSDDDILKILGGNTLRVMREVAQAAKRAQ